MKKTIIYEERDGYKIVTGFGQLAIEPVETRRKVQKLLPQTEEFKEAEAIKTEIGEKHKKAVASFRSAAEAKRSKNIQEEETHSRDWRQTCQEVQDLMDQLPDKAEALKEKRKELFAQNTVYFEPRSGEMEATADHVSMLYMRYESKAEGALIDIDGKEVMDLRGTRYVKKTSGKWTAHTITRLGDTIPKGGKTLDALTDAENAEIEYQRISALGTHEKATEEADALDRALTEAKDMDRTLEIQGDPDHIEKSKSFLETETKRIETAYA